MVRLCCTCRHWTLVSTCTAAYLRQDPASWSSSGSRAFSSSGSSSSSTPLSPVNGEVLQQASSQLCQQVQDVASLTGFAAQPLESSWQFLNPVVLGSSVWEVVHSSTGLPWWASIPLTTIAFRTALLPLTFKAKSAALNWVLLQNSFQTANRLLEQMQQQQGSAPAAAQQQQQSGQLQQLKKPGKLKLVRMYYRYFRKQQKTTSMWWWTGNAVVQVSCCGWHCCVGCRVVNTAQLRCLLYYLRTQIRLRWSTLAARTAAGCCTVQVCRVILEPTGVQGAAAD